MAFQKTKFSVFYKLLKDTIQNSHPELHAVAENFVLEERLTEQREDSYEAFITSPINEINWHGGHGKYIKENIFVSPGTPETFTNHNQPNLLTNIDKDQYLVRLEDISNPVNRTGHSANEMFVYINNFHKNPGNNAAKDIIEKFLTNWNRIRDFRPIFAGFWGEVKDIFTDLKGNEIVNDDWANKLRDRFGLGHYDPMNGEPIPVLLLRYRVSDILDVNPEETKIAAVPTILDSKLSPFFFPTPQNGWNQGQSLDLSAGNENDYSLNCEIVHKFIPYQASYIYHLGWITKSPGKTCEKARKIHLQYLQDDFIYSREI